MSNSRPTRSRISSPFVPANATSDPSRTSRDSAGKVQTFLDTWMEPPLPTPRPSFADAGIARHGVVANMAPLGTRPSLKVMKSARAGSADSARYAPVARKSGLGLSAASSSTASREPELEAEGTAEGTPEPSNMAPVTEEELARSTSIQAEVVESEKPTTPAQQTSPLPIPSSPPPQDPVALPPRPQDVSNVKETANPSVPQSILSVHSPLQAPSPTSVAALILAANPPRVHQSPYGPPPPQVSQSPHSQTSPAPAYKGTHADSAHDPFLHMQRHPLSVEKVDRVVENAVNIAVEQRRWPTAYALRTLWDEHRSDTRIVKLFDCIYDQRASEEQRREFAALMKHKKKEGKKDKTADYYFNGDGSDAPVLPPPPPQIQAPLFAGAIGTPVFRTPVYKTPYQTPYSAPPPAPSTSSAHNPKTPAPISDPQQDSESTTTVASPSASADGTPRPNKKHKGNNFQASEIEMDKAFNNGTSSVTTPERPLARERSKSLSSESSLSSLDEGVIAAGEFMSPVGASHTPRANNAESPSHARNKHNQPISSSKALGPKTHTFSTATLPSSSSVTQQPASSSRTTTDLNNEMPSVVVPSSPLPQQPFFKAKKDQKGVTGPIYDANDLPSRQKRKAKDVTENAAHVRQSFDRHRNAVSASNCGSSEGQAPVKRPTKVRLLNNGRRFNYDSEAGSSPTNLDFKPDLAPGSRSNSRAGTPVSSTRPSRKPKSGTGLRVKSSPMKKKGGTAGIPRAGGERSPVGNGTTQQSQPESDDYCSACGGNGDLVCCDGCVRCFHFKCVDPPMSQGALPDEWYCYSCHPERNDPILEDHNVFGSLLSHMDSRNPSAFHLTKDIREFFEGVKTGAEGEYEEIAAPEKTKNRPGYDEAPDYFKLKDSKGNAIICHLCHKSASVPDRMIIPCGFCGLSWHLDCLDPPLAKEPPVAKKWRCPAHIDDLMSSVPGNLGPAHRFRKIKGASAITPAFSRGIKNNGYIEIENAASDEEDDDFFEQREYGQVYKLPERGIKLDFISRVKSTCHTDGYNPQFTAPINSSQAPNSEPPPAPSEQRSVMEIQAALNMALIASQIPDSTQKLIDALIAQAPPHVLSMIAQGDATNFESSSLTDNEHGALAAMEQLIAQMRSGHNAKAKMATPPLDETNKITTETLDEDTDMLT